MNNAVESLIRHMDLSIIIVNWNTHDLLEKCLQAVYCMVYDIQYEVLVVDNGSTDGSVEMVRSLFPQVSLISNQENLGFAKANNQALKICRGRSILLLNSDAFLQETCVQYMVEVLDTYPGAGIIGANLSYPNGQFQDSYGPLPSMFTETLSLFGLDKILRKAHPRTKEQKVIECGYVSGACLLLRRTLLDEIGLLDENFYFFSEEVDFCFRAHQAGWQVLHDPFAQVVHVGGGSTNLPSERLLMLYRSKLQYFSKHRGYLEKYILFIMIWITSWVKVGVYNILGQGNPKYIDKQGLWFNVIRGLSSTF